MNKINLPEVPKIENLDDVITVLETCRIERRREDDYITYVQRRKISRKEYDLIRQAESFIELQRRINSIDKGVKSRLLNIFCK
jgi:hypothetical protein